MNGSREIGFTILSMTISLAAVFIPIVFMGGIVGRLLHEFAVTIILAIVFSGIVSITLTPMLCSRMLQQRGRPGAQRLLSLERAHLRPHAVALRAHAALEPEPPSGHLRHVSGEPGRGGRPVHDPAAGLPADRRHQRAARRRPKRRTALPSTRWCAISRRRPPSSTPIPTSTARCRRSAPADRRRHEQRLHVHPPEGSLRTARSAPTKSCGELNRKLAAIPGINVFLQNPPVFRIGGQNTKAALSIHACRISI